MQPNSAYIKNLREYLELSLNAFGKPLGYSGTHITRFERGIHEPSDEVISSICVNILASRNRDSGAVETYIPDTETAFDWLNYHS